MHHSVKFFLATVLFLSAASANAGSCSDRSQALLKNLSSGHYAEATSAFDAAMKDGLPPSRLEQVWIGLQTQMGAFQQVGAPHEETTDTKSLTRVLTPLVFEKTQMTAVIACDADHVTGLHFVPKS